MLVHRSSDQCVPVRGELLQALVRQLVAEVVLFPALSELELFIGNGRERLRIVAVVASGCGKSLLAPGFQDVVRRGDDVRPGSPPSRKIRAFKFAGLIFTSSLLLHLMSAELVSQGGKEFSRIARGCLRLETEVERGLNDRRGAAKFLGGLDRPQTLAALGHRA